MKPFTLLAVLLISLTTITGCESEPPPETTDSPLKVVKRDDLFLVARFLDEGSLKALYGARYNPFISFDRILTPREFFVFKVNIEEVKEKRRFVTKMWEFSLGPTSVGRISQFHLLQYWVSNDQSWEIGTAEQRKRDKYIKTELLPAEFAVPPGGRISGLVVFSGNFPRYGTGTLTIPVLDDRGVPVDRIQLTFEF